MRKIYVSSILYLLIGIGAAANMILEGNLTSRILAAAVFAGCVAMLMLNALTVRSRSKTSGR
jgi:hypothetical protein